MPGGGNVRRAHLRPEQDCQQQQRCSSPMGDVEFDYGNCYCPPLKSTSGVRNHKFDWNDQTPPLPPLSPSGLSRRRQRQQQQAMPQKTGRNCSNNGGSDGGGNSGNVQSTRPKASDRVLAKYIPASKCTSSAACATSSDQATDLSCLEPPSPMLQPQQMPARHGRPQDSRRDQHHQHQHQHQQQKKLRLPSCSPKVVFDEEGSSIGEIDEDEAFATRCSGGDGGSATISAPAANNSHGSTANGPAGVAYCGGATGRFSSNAKNQLSQQQQQQQMLQRRQQQQQQQQELNSGEHMHVIIQQLVIQLVGCSDCAACHSWVTPTGQPLIFRALAPGCCRVQPQPPPSPIPQAQFNGGSTAASVPAGSRGTNGRCGQRQLQQD